MPTLAENINTGGQTFQNIAGNAGGGIGDFFGNLIGGLGNGVQGLLTPAGGFLNNILGTTQTTQGQVQAPDQTAQSNSKTLTIVLVVLGVITLGVVAFLVIKSSKSSS